VTGLSNRPVALGLSLAALVVALDQAVKYYVLAVLMQPAPQVIPVTPFFNFVMVWNTGVSFGMFSGLAQWMPYLLSVVAIGIAIFLVVWLRRIERALVVVALGFVIGGALGNVIDRVRFGAVADFLDFHAFGWHFWAFNIADAGISVGVALLIIDGLFRTQETS
jgi:signal peptidase II